MGPQPLCASLRLLHPTYERQTHRYTFVMGRYMARARTSRSDSIQGLPAAESHQHLRREWLDQQPDTVSVLGGVRLRWCEGEWCTPARIGARVRVGDGALGGGRDDDGRVQQPGRMVSRFPRKSKQRRGHPG